jgi:hypothetical protein
MTDPVSPAPGRPDGKGQGPRYRWDPAERRSFKTIRLREDLEGHVAEVTIEVASIAPATGDGSARA